MSALARDLAVLAEYRLVDPEGNKFDLSQAKGWEVDIDVWEVDGERRHGRFATGEPGTRREMGSAGRP